jgi:hypothetical protein
MSPPLEVKITPTSEFPQSSEVSRSGRHGITVEELQVGTMKTEHDRHGSFGLPVLGLAQGSG